MFDSKRVFSVSVLTPVLRLFLYFCLFFSLNIFANEFDEEEEVVLVYLDKIRDAEGNYLMDVTKATAKFLSKTGEYKVKRYKRKSYESGPIIRINPPKFTFAPHKDGMSTKELAAAGLGLVADVGGLFGFDKEADKAKEADRRLAKNGDLLDRFDDDQQILVTMESRVLVEDEDTGAEVSRKIKFKKVFENKALFLEKQDEVIQKEVIAALKVALVEYVEDSE
jgi:hypothetical protein